MCKSASVDCINRELASAPAAALRASSAETLGMGDGLSESFERVNGGMPVAVSLHSEWGELFLIRARQQWMFIHPSTIDMSKEQHSCVVEEEEEEDEDGDVEMAGPHRTYGCVQMRVTIRVYGMRSQLDHAHVCVTEVSPVSGVAHRICEAPNDPARHHTALLCTENADIYACSITGRMHVCGDECRESVSRGKLDDSSYVCRVTGNVNRGLGQQMASSVFFRSGDRCDVERLGEAKKAFREVGGRKERRQDRKRMLIKSRALLKDTKRIRLLAEKHPPLSVWTTNLLGCTSFASVIGMINDTASAETIGIYGMVDRYLRVARGMVFMLFCEERRMRERNISVHTQSGAMERIKGQVLETLSSEGGQLVFSQISEVGVRYVQSQTFLPCLDWDPATTLRMTIDHADRVVNLWYFLRTETETGRAVPNAFPFQGFVFGALTMLARGLSDRRVSIIAPDPGVMRNLPTVNGVVECYSTGQNKIYVDNIAYALVQAVHQEGMSADRLSTYVSDLTRANPAVFTKSIKAAPCAVSATTTTTLLPTH